MLIGCPYQQGSTWMLWDNRASLQGPMGTSSRAISSKERATPDVIQDGPAIYAVEG
ncbi:hypothetical protein V8C34DRAFT_266881 [Trichoderma compactum]